MDKKDSDFVKLLVLRFINVYPVNINSGYKLDDLCFYLTNMCPALCYVYFQKDLLIILNELIEERLISTKEFHDMSNAETVRFLQYSLTESGKAKAEQIFDFTIINIVLDEWIKKT